MKPQSCVTVTLTLLPNAANPTANALAQEADRGREMIMVVHQLGDLLASHVARVDQHAAREAVWGSTFSAGRFRDEPNCC